MWTFCCLIRIKVVATLAGVINSQLISSMPALCSSGLFRHTLRLLKARYVGKNSDIGKVCKAFRNLVRYRDFLMNLSKLLVKSNIKTITISDSNATNWRKLVMLMSICLVLRLVAIKLPLEKINQRSPRH